MQSDLPTIPVPASRPRRRPLTERARRAFVVTGFAFLSLVLALLVADRIAPPPLARALNQSVIVTAKDGRVLRAFLASDGIWRMGVHPLDVDPNFIRMLIAYEDQRFAEHPGFDPLAMGRAMWQLLANMRVVSGASTLTMQVARLLEPRPRTIGSKLIEVARALQLEAHFTKDEILALYLTLAPYGGNIEGVRAASLAYFGKEPSRLTLEEAAFLVALPQSPERQRPDRNPQEARLGRDKVLLRLAERGFLDAKAVREAMGEPSPSARIAYPFRAPHLSERLARGATPGSQIATTVVLEIQDAMERLITAERVFLTQGASIGMIIVENATGDVIAHVGNADYWGAFGQIDMTRALRSPGSTLKPFIYGLAFNDLALHPLTLIDDKRMAFGDYAPRNFDRGFQGTVTIAEALQHSLNVPAVALLDRVGPVRFAEQLRFAGAKFAFPRSWTAPSLPMALGGVGLTLNDLTQLYTAFPGGGVTRPLRYVRDEPRREGVRLFSESSAYYVTQILRGVPLPDGWAMGRGIQRSRAIGFKTGTSYGYRDAWTVGFSTRYTVGVWVGRPDGSTRPGHFGRNEAAPLMLKAFELLPAEPSVIERAPENIIVAGRTEELPVAMQAFHTKALEAPPGIARAPGPPQIMFPPDGATVAVAEASGERQIVLEAEGGRAPLRWIVNGEILPEVPRYAETFFTPEGLGFTEITVVDAEGRSDRSTVRFTREP
ncbi:MAG: penicillin-binding protein 1C [Alphaproteobacteria bacterium]|nr:penicillin-binding protein 1C [Alphaproteobacteria bacterium]